MTTRRRDPIADLERLIVDGNVEKWRTLGVSEAEVQRWLPDLRAQAKAIATQLRAEHLARTGAST